MTLSVAMKALVEQGYHLFRRYPVPTHFNVCCRFCFSDSQQQALRQTPLRAVPFALLNAWNSSINPEMQDIDEIRYLLPRLLELLAYKEFPGVYEGSCLQRMGEIPIQHWRADERLFLGQFSQRFICDWLLPDDAVELGIILEMFWRGGIDIAPLLDTVLCVPGYWVTVSLAWLLFLHREDTVRDAYVEQDSEDEAITQIIRTWAARNRSLLAERARLAIETPAARSLAGTKYAIEADSWMIDECLCVL